MKNLHCRLSPSFCSKNIVSSPMSLQHTELFALSFSSLDWEPFLMRLSFSVCNGWHTVVLNKPELKEWIDDFEGHYSHRRVRSTWSSVGKRWPWTEKLGGGEAPEWSRDAGRCWERKPTGAVLERAHAISHQDNTTEVSTLALHLTFGLFSPSGM